MMPPTLGAALLCSSRAGSDMWLLSRNYIKRQLNFVNASYLFTHISYLEKTYTITAQEPSILFENELGTFALV